MEENVWADMPRMELQTESRRALTVEELSKVIGSATGWLKYLFVLGIYTGIRLGDACLLKWEAVDFERGLIVYMPMKTKRKQKIVSVPIHPVLREMLEGMEQGKGYLEPELADYYLRDNSAVSKLVQKHFKANGIETSEFVEGQRRGRKVQRVGFHSLRHSFVSLCAANNTPQVILMELVGHGSPAMSRLYSHAGDGQKKGAVERLPEF